jgi:hypothetical protein
MEDLFERPSIRAIAAHLETALENGSGVQLAS